MKKIILSLSFLLLLASTYAQSFSKKGGGGSDNWGSQVVVHTGCLTGTGVAGDSLDVASGCITPSKLDRTYLTAEVDGSVTNELQDLSLSGNTLSLTGDGTTVSLAAYVNTDNQDLTLSNDTLYLDGDATPVSLAAYVNTDNQDLTLSGNTLALTGDGTTVSLAAYVNTDNQDLTLSGNTLSLSGDATSVSLSAYVNTDAQDLTLSGNTLSLTGDATTVSLASYVNTDAQTLSISNDTLSISGGNSVILPTGTVAVNDTITNAQTTTSTSFVDITNASLTFPSAGTWQVTYQINYSANSNTQNSYFRMITNTSTVIGNSCLTLDKASSALSYNASRTFFVTVASSVTYKLQWKSGSGANTMTLLNNKTENSSSIIALRVR
jgi:hypothetical protein